MNTPHVPTRDHRTIGRTASVPRTVLALPLLLGSLTLLGGFTECTTRIDIDEPNLAPEGIAFSQQRDAFLVSSLTRGTIGEVDHLGNYTELVVDRDLVNTAGLAVDEARGRLLACNSFLGFPDFAPAPGSIHDGAAPGSVIALGIYDLADGQRLHYVDLSALSETQIGHVCNDVVVDDQGNAYVTDSVTPAIYRVTPSGEASLLVEDPTLVVGPGEFHLNGIVYHPDGYLVVSRYQTGQLFRVDPSAPALEEIDLGGVDLLHGDGLAFDDDLDLVVVQNRQFGVGADRITRVRSDDDFHSVDVVEWTEHDWLAGPTTAVNVDGDIFVLNAHIEQFLLGADQPDYQILAARP